MTEKIQVERLKKNSMFVARMVNGEGYLVPVSHDREEIRKIYRLNDMGWAIWKSIDSAQDLADLCSRISEGYEVDIETALSDTRKFLEELLKLGALVLEEE
ncbi:MAG: PqqD family protein [Deltaproteobacteria bacterium]|nr:PqqD family protein [Deltaproteobacteria bacterium]